MNGALNKSLVNPRLATSVSFRLVLFLAIGLFACRPKPLPSMRDLADMPSGRHPAASPARSRCRRADADPARRRAGQRRHHHRHLFASLAIDHFGLFRME